MMAEIKQMYHHVKVLLVEADALRFLWRDNAVEGLSEYTMFGTCFWEDILAVLFELVITPGFFKNRHVISKCHQS